jgi:glucose/arabinose dehydrogenase
MARFRFVLAGCTLTFGTLVAGCLPASDGLPPPLRVSAALKAEYVVDGAAHPAGLAFAPDGRVFYTEKNTGLVRVVQDGVLLPDPFAATPVNAAGERGLLGITLHPAFDANGRVYVFYTRSDTGLVTADPQAVLDNRVVYFESAGNVANGGEIFVASLPAADGVVNIGGRIGFGRDRMLYIALGDLGNDAAAQDPARRNGKLLRVQDDGAIPTDNPTAGSPVFARGLRDVRGLTFDTISGGVFCADLNPAGEHELNHVTPGVNLGWSQVTGQAVTGSELAFAQDNADYANPVLDTGTKVVPLVGAAFNPSGKYGHFLRDHLFFSEASARRIVEVQLSEDRFNVTGRSTVADGFPAAITDVAFTPGGTLYVATVNAIFRVLPVE